MAQQTACTTQTQWAWCGECYGLFYSPNIGISQCPAGGTHSNSGGNYGLIMNAPQFPGEQHWRWCDKCQGLFYGPFLQSACPAGGQHVRGSASYTVSMSTNPPALPSEGMWLNLVGAYPSLTQSAVYITGMPSDQYNCIAYTLGYTDRWINPQSPLSQFLDQYRVCNYAALPALSSMGLIDGWCIHTSIMLHADRVFPISETMWESKLGTGPRITHLRQDLVGDLLGSVAVSFNAMSTSDRTPPDEPALSIEEVARLRERASLVVEVGAAEFGAALDAWMQAWRQLPTAFSSNTHDYAAIAEFDALVHLGVDVIPLVAAHLAADNGFFLLPLVERLLGRDPAPKVHPHESEQSRARRVARSFLADELK